MMIDRYHNVHTTGVFDDSDYLNRKIYCEI